MDADPVVWVEFSSDSELLMANADECYFSYICHLLNSKLFELGINFLLGCSVTKFLQLSFCHRQTPCPIL